jgi:ribose 5-phosphate isomerase B
MRIAIACDHRGFTVKQTLKIWLQERGHQVMDLGTHTDQACDYPDMALAAGMSIFNGEADRAVLVCGTGIGMSIVVNKVPGVRGALCHDQVTAELARRHNDANCLCLPGDMLTDGVAMQIVEAWLETPFEGGRHERRLKKIQEFEQKLLSGQLGPRKGPGAAAPGDGGMEASGTSPAGPGRSLA